MTYPNEKELGILLIEDEKTFAEYIKQTLEETFEGAQVDFSLDFDGGISLLKQKRPNILILDLYRGEIAEKDLAGGAVWEHIWKELFIPIIIYTAYAEGVADLKPEIPKDHPFISYIQKGKGSEDNVVAKIKSFQPSINALREFTTEIDKSTQVVLKTLSPLIWGSGIDESTKHEVLVRSARRRLGAWMDLATIIDDKPLQCWEQYIVPPLGNDLLMGDIIKTCNSEKDKLNPTSYRLVLSPSCDLVRQKGSAKVEHVLVAQCSEITKYPRACGIDPKTEPKKMKESLKNRLTHPQQGGIIALSGLPSLLPSMSVCLRELNLIPLNKIACSDKEKVDSSKFDYERVASVDSPFREQIQWGFLQIECRPGVPQMDYSSLVDEIVKRYSAE